LVDRLVFYEINLVTLRKNKYFLSGIAVHSRGDVTPPRGKRVTGAEWNEHVDIDKPNRKSSNLKNKH